MLRRVSLKRSVRCSNSRWADPPPSPPMPPSPVMSVPTVLVTSAPTALLASVPAPWSFAASSPERAVASSSRCARCHATSSRACRTLQWPEAFRKAASVSADATSARGSTRSSESSPEARPSARQGNDSRLAAERTHWRAVDVLIPHCPVTHATIEIAPSPRHPSARSNSAMSASCSRCNDEICRGPPHDLKRQLLRTGVASEVPARWTTTPRPVFCGRRLLAHRTLNGRPFAVSRRRDPPSPTRLQGGRRPVARHVRAASRGCAHVDRRTGRIGSEPQHRARPAPRRSGARR